MDRPSICRVILFEDHEIVVTGLTACLAALPDFEVVATYGTSVFDEDRVRQLAPHLALVDVELPERRGERAERRGIETARALHDILPNLRVVVFTAFVTQALLHDAMAIAHGYLLKTTPPSELIDTLRRVMAGERVLPPPLASLFLGKFAAQKATGEYNLSPAELRVLKVMATGATNRQIAETLHIAEETVRSHVASILGKMGAPNRTAAAVLAWRAGLLDDE